MILLQDYSGILYFFAGLAIIGLIILLILNFFAIRFYIRRHTKGFSTLKKVYFVFVMILNVVAIQFIIFGLFYTP